MQIKPNPSHIAGKPFSITVQTFGDYDIPLPIIYFEPTSSSTLYILARNLFWKSSSETDWPPEAILVQKMISQWLW